MFIASLRHFHFMFHRLEHQCISRDLLVIWHLTLVTIANYRSISAYVFLVCSGAKSSQTHLLVLECLVCLGYTELSVFRRLLLHL